MIGLILVRIVVNCLLGPYAFFFDEIPMIYVNYLTLGFEKLDFALMRVALKLQLIKLL